MSPLAPFISAVHRRMVVLRLLERVGLGLSFGCAAALLTTPILLCRGQPVWNLITLMLGLGALAGLIAGAIKRPTRLAAAMEADRQLSLADLLGTAVTIRSPSSDFEKTVLALAEARCAAASPSAVLVNKLGARSWGGIALAVGLISALGLMGGQERANARAQAIAPAKSWIEIEQERASAAHAAASPDTRIQPRTTGGDDNDPIRSAVNTDPTHTRPAGNNTGADNTGAGTGTGAAQSNTTTTSDRTNIVGGNSTSTDKTGAAAGGGAGSNTRTTDGKTGIATGAQKARPAPPWHSAAWPAARSAADDAIRAGKVAPAHQAIVRDYFER